MYTLLIFFQIYHHFANLMFCFVIRSIGFVMHGGHLITPYYTVNWFSLQYEEKIRDDFSYTRLRKTLKVLEFNNSIAAQFKTTYTTKYIGLRGDIYTSCESRCLDIEKNGWTGARRPFSKRPSIRF